MGGLISVIICVLAATVFFGTGHPVLFWLSIAAGIIAFWSWGVMHNLASASARRRHDLVLKDILRRVGQTEEEIEQFDAGLIGRGLVDINAVPNWLTAINMLATFTGVTLLVWSAIVRFL